MLHNLERRRTKRSYTAVTNGKSVRKLRTETAPIYFFTQNSCALWQKNRKAEIWFEHHMKFYRTWVAHVAHLSNSIVIHLERIQLPDAHIPMNWRHDPHCYTSTERLSLRPVRSVGLNPLCDQRCSSLYVWMGRPSEPAGTAAALQWLQTSAGPERCEGLTPGTLQRP